ncbi:hypothetical protein E0Z10_g3076 [Xylaria hypoxylon]|uniref:HRDC domain-containing protein n=1 Tax=Xylaria hypoxylon TaxID=37992 RepID=A0A4Z0Z2U0_9PEZI|nr:hypothetical protein E0Z10_g3076 [Xylaria hypoxylon]
MLIPALEETKIQIYRFSRYVANTYAIRAVTRNPSSASAKTLEARGVSIVYADLNDVAPLNAAIAGSHIIFAVTDFWGPFKELGQERAAVLETVQGVNIATAALATLGTLQHYIYSTLPDVSRITSGAVRAPHYESKARVKEYIESQPGLRAVTTFVWPGFYTSNLAWDILKPVHKPTAGQYVQLQGVSEDTPVYCLGDSRANFGIFVRAILKQKKKVGGGKIVFAYVEKITLGQLLPFTDVGSGLWRQGSISTNRQAGLQYAVAGPWGSTSVLCIRPLPPPQRPVLIAVYITTGALILTALVDVVTNLARFIRVMENDNLIPIDHLNGDEPRYPDEILRLMEDDNPTVLFNRDEPQWPMTFAMRPQGHDEAPRQWWHAHDCRGPQGQSVEVLYSKTKARSESIARYFANKPVLGFDMEWPWGGERTPRLQDKVAVIQLASERKIALFHIALHEGDTVDDIIAPTLKEIIESPKIIKVGVGILHYDFRRLRGYFNLEPKGAFELSHLHNLVTYGPSNPRQVTTNLCSLSIQAEKHLGLPVSKGSVRTSDWSQPLDGSQLQYAATDAYAGFMLFHCINAKRLSMNPVPPLPVFAEAYLLFTGPKATMIRLESVTEDGEVQITTVDDFFRVKKDVEQNGEATNEAAIMGGESQHNQRRKRDRKPRTKAKLAGNANARTTMDDSCWKLYNRLASHRTILAMSKSISAYIIAHNTLLQALTLYRPSNEQELLLVPGVGKRKLEQYGSAWLEIIANFETEQKQGDGHDAKQGAGDQAECGESDLGLGDQDPKRRKFDHVDGSKEIVMLSDAPPTVLSTGVPFQSGETSLADNPSTLPRPEKQDDSKDDGAVFRPSMEPPSSLALKRKRDIVV